MKKAIFIVFVVLALIGVSASVNAAVLTGDQMAAEILGSSKTSGSMMKSACPTKAATSSSDLGAFRKQLLRDLEARNQRLAAQERAENSAELDKKLGVISADLKDRADAHDRRMVQGFNWTNNTVWQTGKWIGDKVDHRFWWIVVAMVIGFAAMIVAMILFGKKLIASLQATIATITGQNTTP